MRVDNKKYLQSCDICKRSKAQNNKPYGSMQALSVSTHKWNTLGIDFVRDLKKNKDISEVEYCLIFVIFNQLTKMIYYESVLTTLSVDHLAIVLIEEVI